MSIVDKHHLFYFPYASFTNEQLPLLKVAALYFDKLVILTPSVRAGRRSARITSLATRSRS